MRITHIFRVGIKIRSRRNHIYLSKLVWMELNTWLGFFNCDDSFGYLSSSGAHACCFTYSLVRQIPPNLTLTSLRSAGRAPVIGRQRFGRKRSRRHCKPRHQCLLLDRRRRAQGSCLRRAWRCGLSFRSSQHQVGCRACFAIVVVTAPVGWVDGALDLCFAALVLQHM